MRDDACMQTGEAPEDSSQAAAASGLLGAASSLFTTLTGVPSMGGSLSRGGTASSFAAPPLHSGVSEELADDAGLGEEDSLDPSALLCTLNHSPCTCADKHSCIMTKVRYHSQVMVAQVVHYQSISCVARRTNCCTLVLGRHRQ